jgi:glutamyl-tRNA reductase
VKDACDTAREAGTLGPELNLLSQVTLNVAKQVRTDTDIGRNPVSVAYAPCRWQQIFADLRRTPRCCSARVTRSSWSPNTFATPVSVR